MAQFRKICDVYQGYNYKKDKQTNVGYITAITIGGNTLAADQSTCKDPLNPTSNISVVAVLSDVMWEIGVTDAVYFTGQISVYNKQTVQTMIYDTLTSVATTFTFDVYEYDLVADKYFKCFTCAGTTMNGLLEQRGQDLNLYVADDRSTEVQSPANFTFTIGIKPQPSAQSLTIATADQKNIVKPWGTTVSG